MAETANTKPAARIIEAYFVIMTGSLGFAVGLRGRSACAPVMIVPMLTATRVVALSRRGVDAGQAPRRNADNAQPAR